MKIINFFTGNRAEFGILFPLITEFSKKYFINLIVGGAHLLKRWNTLDEIKNKFDGNSNIEIRCLQQNEKSDTIHNFALNISEINRAYLEFKKNDASECLFVLGDRIETFSVVATELYCEGKIVHIAGGDVANMPAFDNNIRHAITKMSHLHLVTNERSYHNVRQLGEEEWRICNIGMPSLDLISKNRLPTKEELRERYCLSGEAVVIATFHPDQYYDPEDNLTNFRKFYRGLSEVEDDVQIIVTYPNNDPGHALILQEIENNIQRKDSIRVIRNLGSDNYLGLLKHFDAVMVGNSSGILTESSFLNIPALLIGRRQIGRLRGKNVTEIIDFRPIDIKNFINYAFSKYRELRNSFNETQFIYGNGHASRKALAFLEKVFNERNHIELLTKKFVEMKGIS